MNVVISPKAAKYLRRLNEPQKGRIIKALEQLAKEPPEGDIKSLTGRDGYRLRVGDYRVLFDIIDAPVIETDLTEEEKAIIREGREEYKSGGYIPLTDI